MATDETSPPGYFLNGGDHFDDIPHGRRGAVIFERVLSGRTDNTPRDIMLRYISNGNWKRQVRTMNNY